MEVTMKRFFSFVTGVMVGGLVGATFALLFAPSEGKVLQDQMKSTFIELKDEVVQAASSKRVELTEQLDSLRKG
jgi:gas vesicle protein